MVSQSTIDLVTQLVKQTQDNLTAYQEILDALNTQLKTDQSSIDMAVATQISAVLSPIQTAITAVLPPA